MLKINEIFYSIQGESSRAGLPTVFVRTSGCNLRCNYCDTTYAYYEGHEMTVDSVLSEIGRFSAKSVCITGGEPLLQKSSLELMTRLCDLGYSVSLETSGSRDCSEVDSRVLIVLDVKTPDSDEGKSFDLRNLKLHQPMIEYKFVICSEKDFEWSENFCRQHDLGRKHAVLYSPAFEKVEARWLAEEILKKNSSARLHLQLHKYIWSGQLRGV